MKRILTILTLLLCLASNVQAQQKRLNLFSDELKTAYPSVVYDFLERYLAEVKMATPGYELNQKMSDDKVTVCGGSLNNISSINPNVPFSMSRMDEKYYEVKWNAENGTVLLDIIFPIQYELLLGKPKIEMEKMMKAELDSCSTTFEATTMSDSLVLTEDCCYVTKTIDHYYVESLNTASYYMQGTNNSYTPVYDDTKRWYSAANLFHLLISDQDYQLYIQQSVYGFKQVDYMVKLSQWLNYCKQNKLTIYFAIEDEYEDGLKALLIAHSSDLGYNHMLSLILPDNFVIKRNSVIKAQMNAFIPTQNIKDLYQKYTRKPKKNI